MEYFAVYEMPVHYRNFYIRKLSNTKEKEKAAYDKAMGAVEATPQQRVVKGPQVNRR